jgi:hypothetical protein
VIAALNFDTDLVALHEGLSVRPVLINWGTVRRMVSTGMANEQFRRCLHGHSSCWAFETGKPRQRAYTLRQRREAFEEMIVLATVALTETGKSKPLSPAAAWRLAVQSWLQFHGMITIALERKLLPIFP